MAQPESLQFRWFPLDCFLRHDSPQYILNEKREPDRFNPIREPWGSFGAYISTRKANLILLNLGILEERERDSFDKNKKTKKKFKSLTKLGLRFGKNLISPQNERETQPHYYDSTFPELLEMILNKIEEAA
ncbi:MAG: hypothetical protein HQL72_06750 [Magnetococcales bacterium]|nr:hypothetical protein [Magnetococcales bacterium]